MSEKTYDPTSPRFDDARERMSPEEWAEYAAYVATLPEGSSIVWRCTVYNDESRRGFQVK